MTNQEITPMPFREQEQDFKSLVGTKIVVDGIPRKVFRIILTIAHLDHNISNNAPENLKALCQKCHLQYDATHHAETRKAKKQLKLL